MKHVLKIAVTVLVTFFLVPGLSEAKHLQHRVKSSPATLTRSADPEASAKTIPYGAKDVVKLNTKVRFTSVIVLPESEQILDFVCGDKDFWVVNGNENIAYVKAAKEGAMTNLNLITASGNIYSFVLVEVSNLPNTEPDLKVFIEPKEQSMISAANAPRRFVPRSEVEGYLQRIEDDNKEIQHLNEIRDKEIDKAVHDILSKARFTYRFDPKKKPFHVKAIWHDAKFTYIQAEPEETPTLYEVRDGKPNLVNFEYKDGVYVAEKVIDRGYLAVGKSRLLFMRHE